MSRAPTDRRPGRNEVVARILVVLAPIVVLGASPWAANGQLVYLGMLPAAMGLLIGRRAALAASALLPIAMAIGVLLRDQVAAGAVAMAVVAALVGASSTRGWHGIGAFIGPQMAFALIGEPSVALPSGTVIADHSATSVVVLMAWVAAGGCWITIIAGPVAAAVDVGGPAPVTASAARWFAVALATLVGAATAIALGWVDTPNAWWSVLTLFVVVQPSIEVTRARTAARVAGTVCGAAAAALVAVALTDVPGVATVVALVMTAAAGWAYLNRPYWVFATFLTAGVILQTSGGRTALLRGDVDRVVFTVVAAAAAAVVLGIGHLVVSRRRDRSASPNASS